MPLPGWVPESIGPAAVAAVLGWVGKSMASHHSTKTLVREMHTALVGEEATELNPHPPPGLVDRVGAVEGTLEDQRPLLERVGRYLDSEGVPPSPARRGPPSRGRVGT